MQTGRIKRPVRLVPRRRIELRTRGFSVHCSTRLSYLGQPVTILAQGSDLSSGFWTGGYRSKEPPVCEGESQDRGEILG